MRTATFTDFDAFSETVTDVDCVMTLQNPRNRRWAVGQIQLPRTHVQWGKLGSGNIVEGQSWSNSYLLYLPLSSHCEYSINGTVFKKGSALIFEPGSEFCLSTVDEHDWCSILVPEHHLANQRALNSASGTGHGLCKVTEPDHRLTSSLESAIADLFLTSASNPDFEASPAASVAEAQLIKAVSAFMGNLRADRPTPTGRPEISRRHIIRRAIECMEQRSRHPFSVKELAVAVRVSERTLRSAFHSWFGVGPARYMKLRQLNQVRHDLKAARPDEDSVSDILLQKGVWEHGGFASHYTRFFGETPSTTLRSAP